MVNHVRKAAAVAALSLLGCFGAVGTAQAAIYSGSWDPAYGGIFPDLSWSAEAEFLIPDSCAGTQDYSTATCSGFASLGGTVTFSSISNAAPDDVETLGASFLLIGFSMTNSVLTGVTGTFNEVTPTASFAGGGNYSFTLSLDEASATLYAVTPAGTSPICLNNPNCSESANLSQGTFTNVTPVPEPGTYALLLAGLGALGFLARRKA